MRLVLVSSSLTIVLFIICHLLCVLHVYLYIIIYIYKKKKTTLKKPERSITAQALIRVWSNLPNTSLMENFIFCAVHISECHTVGRIQGHCQYYPKSFMHKKKKKYHENNCQIVEVCVE